MLKMTTCGWFIREGHEKDRVNIFWTNSLCEGVAVSVDMKKWIRGWKRAKGGLHNWPGVGRVQDDESVDGHLRSERKENDRFVSASGETSRVNPVTITLLYLGDGC